MDILININGVDCNLIGGDEYSVKKREMSKMMFKIVNWMGKIIEYICV